MSAHPHLRRCLRLAAIGACLLTTTALPAAGQDPAAAPARGWRDPLRYRDLLWQGVTRLGRVEGVEMFVGLVTGSAMDGDGGWFHPSQNRYGWKWLADRYDADHNGTITRAEFGGPPELFDRLDRNRDGVLTADDFDWSDRSMYLRMNGSVTGLFRFFDANSNGRISPEEWDAFFKKAARGKGYMTPTDLQEALNMTGARPPAAAAGSGMPSPYTLITGLFTGELGSLCEGPGLGQPAPDFTLRTQDGKRAISLASYRGKKPVVLVFGSFT